MQTTRRNFIRSTSALAGTSLFSFAPLEVLASQRKRVSANDKLQLGVIGCKGMGWSDLRSHLQLSDVECIALCDVDQSVLDMRAADVEKAQGKRPQLYKDYRKMLENKDIDAVIIGTPDHWHCLTLMDSLAAGKHVYCEKPLANSIEECNLMLSAAKKSNKIIQIGQWQRSG
jgi:predicted dehydrogenase